MLSSESKKLRVAVVGGGIGGLTFAVALSQLALDELVQVNIYESTAELTQIGAGITLSPRGWEIIKDLGLDKELAGRLGPGETSPDSEELKLCFVLRKSDQKQGQPIVDIMMRGAVSFHRADIQEVLLKHVSPNMKPHLSHRLSTYTETKDGIELKFTNGSKATCDILVGADGINSVVRKVFLSKEKGIDPSSEEAAKVSQPVWSGTMVYRSLINSEVIRRVNPDHPALSTRVVYCGKNKHIVAYPILQGKLVNIVSFVTDLEREDTDLMGPPMLAETTDNITSLFDDWEEDARLLVTSMEKPSRWAIQTGKTLDRYASGRVALLGDSAHAMTPHLGNGAGQAMEDAWILAKMINQAIRQESLSICRVTDIYSTSRKPFVNWVVSLSREQGLRYELLGAGFEDVQEGATVSRERLTELGRTIERDWEWTWKTSPCDDLQKALSILDQHNIDNGNEVLLRGRLINVILATWQKPHRQLSHIVFLFLKTLKFRFWG